MHYLIRDIRKEEYNLLNNFIYEAIFIPEGMEAPTKSIINQAELKVYVYDFGKKKDDYCLVAEFNGKVVGAVWVRIMNDYGHIDDTTPSLAISLYKEYRGCGIGTDMMRKMLLLLKSNEYDKVSLSVQKENYALQIYLNVGFEIIDENEDEYIMVCYL
ncbi:GNAT family N-acetyltransferase [Clostridium butyricum]|uniref:GNAT family N-acetyltransferase n=1 Tax=Clostridium butyricum TaxID=1492 RepID=UPI0024B9B0FE|nr:GNAT family N-acetyltransferase [Clostridium butyricum]